MTDEQVAAALALLGWRARGIFGSGPLAYLIVKDRTDTTVDCIWLNAKGGCECAPQRKEALFSVTVDIDMQSIPSDALHKMLETATV